MKEYDEAQTELAILVGQFGYNKPWDSLSSIERANSLTKANQILNLKGDGWNVAIVKPAGQTINSVRIAEVIYQG